MFRGSIRSKVRARQFAAVGSGASALTLALMALGSTPALAQAGDAVGHTPQAVAAGHAPDAHAAVPQATTDGSIAGAALDAGAVLGAGAVLDTGAGSPAITSVAAPRERPQKVTTKAERWLHFTTKSEETLDLNGVEESLYRGKFYRPSLETKRRCIVRRESNGHYFSISRSGYRGAYQMSAALARGVTWMMLPEHRGILGDEIATKVLAALRETPANRWPRYWQDAAFSTIHNWEHAGSGASHWYGGRWHC